MLTLRRFHSLSGAVQGLAALLVERLLEIVKEIREHDIFCLSKSALRISGLKYTPGWRITAVFRLLQLTNFSRTSLCLTGCSLA